MDGEQGDVITPGEIVAGKYRIENLLGSGGMGFVIGARHVTLDERVAIKMLRSAALSDPEAKVRFLREARASGRIKGEHVARVIDVGEEPSGTPYIVMEHLDGRDLSDVLKRQGPVDVVTAVGFVLQACEALAEAHALGIVHRDLKPSNLFLTRRVDGSVCLKVLDFGIAKAVGPVDQSTPEAAFTATQSVLGTPQYMAPEQMRSSRRADARSDIWAVGSVLYELLVGHPPFVAETMPELFAMILQDPTPSIVASRREVPAALDAVTMRCLEKEAHRRFPNVHELAQALAPFGGPDAYASAARIANVAHNVGFRTGSLTEEDLRSDRFQRLPPSASGAMPVASTQGTAAPSHPWLVGIVLALLLALGATGAFLIVRTQRMREAAMVSSPTVTLAPPPPAASAELPPAAASASAAAPPSFTEPTAAASSTPPPASARSGRPPKPGVLPAKPASATSAPPAPASTKAPDVKPQATASSRYD